MEIAISLRRHLVDELGSDRFDLWFRRGVTLSVDQGILTVSTGDQFRLDRLRPLRHALAKAAEAATGHVVEVVFQLTDDQKPADPASGESNAARSHVSPAVAGSPIASELPEAARREPGESMPGDVSANGSDASAPAFGGARRVRRIPRTLASFVVGDSNRVAHAAILRTPKRLGQFSPLFIHGPTGTGKTHLLESVCEDVRQPCSRRVVLLTSEQFTNQFLEALRGSGLPSFRHKYRDVDLLAIDDVQFFQGKRATIVELQHTVDSLLRNGRQLVFAADRPPSELTDLGQELVGRLAGGVLCETETLDPDVRLGILRQIVARRRLTCDESVLDYIAQQIGDDARQLFGAMNRLQLASETVEQPITLNLALAALADLVQAARRPVRLADIDRVVCRVFGLSEVSLRAAPSSQLHNSARMLAMWLARQHTRSAYAEIGSYFGRRSHSTVISATAKVQRLVDEGGTVRTARGTCPIRDTMRRAQAELRCG